MWEPHAKYDHVYVIVRVDSPETSDSLPEDRITLTKAFCTREAAEAEVTRLNRLNAPKGSRYFWRIARLERASTQSGPPAAASPDTS